MTHYDEFSAITIFNQTSTEVYKVNAYSYVSLSNADYHSSTVG